MAGNVFCTLHMSRDGAFWTQKTLIGKGEEIQAKWMSEGHMHSNWLKARLGHHAPDSVCIYLDNCGLAINFGDPRDKTFDDN